MVISWMCVSISWRSKRTRDSGVVRSTVRSEALFVLITRVLANEVGVKVGERMVA